jgi:hypothetical protein
MDAYNSLNEITTEGGAPSRFVTDDRSIEARSTESREFSIDKRTKDFIDLDSIYQNASIGVA